MLHRRAWIPAALLVVAAIVTGVPTVAGAALESTPGELIVRDVVGELTGPILMRPQGGFVGTVDGVVTLWTVDGDVDLVVEQNFLDSGPISVGGGHITIGRAIHRRTFELEPPQALGTGCDPDEVAGDVWIVAVRCGASIEIFHLPLNSAEPPILGATVALGGGGPWEVVAYSDIVIVGSADEIVTYDRDGVELGRLPGVVAAADGPRLVMAREPWARLPGGWQRFEFGASGLELGLQLPGTHDTLLTQNDYFVTAPIDDPTALTFWSGTTPVRTMVPVDDGRERSPLSGDSPNSFLVGWATSTEGSRIELWEPHEYVDHACTRFGTYGDDVIVGTPGDDAICALSGDDRVFAGDGDDIVHTGSGDDVSYGGNGMDDLVGGPDSDVLYGGPGDDFLTTMFGSDEAWGQSGNDALTAFFGSATLGGGAGDDVLLDARGGSTLYGGYDDDEFLVGRGTVAFGGHGVDTVRPTSAPGAVVYLGLGDDVVTAGCSNCMIFGGPGNDTLHDVGDVDGGADDDDIVLTRGTLATGGTGNDTIVNDRAGATIIGGPGDDTLTLVDPGIAVGLAGDDTLTGSNGDDELWGGTGFDTIDGRSGIDQCWANGGTVTNCP